MLSYFVLFAVFLSAIVSGQASEECSLADWNQNTDKVTEFNNIIQLAQSISFIRDIIKGLDPISIDTSIVSEKFSFLGYEYQVDVSLDDSTVAGIGEAYVDLVNVTSAHSLAAGGHIRGNLLADLKLTAKVTQLTLTGCDPETEEEYGGLCYKPCRELAGPNYPRRIMTNTCGGGGHGLWTKGLGCNGFGVGADSACATPKYRVCVTDKLNFEGRCDPLTASVKAVLGLNNPVFSVDTLLKAFMCSADLPSGSKCKDISPDDIVNSLIGGDIDGVLERGLRRVGDFGINSVAIDFDEITDLDVDVMLGDKDLASNFLDWVAEKVMHVLNENDKIRSLVLNGLGSAVKNLFNDFIDDKYASKFGSTCYDP